MSNIIILIIYTYLRNSSIWTGGNAPRIYKHIFFIQIRVEKNKLYDAVLPRHTQTWIPYHKKLFNNFSSSTYRLPKLFESSSCLWIKQTMRDHAHTYPLYKMNIFQRLLSHTWLNLWKFYYICSRWRKKYLIILYIYSAGWYSIVI